MTKATKKNNKVLQRLLSILIAFSLLFYVGYQTYRSIFSGVKTELAVSYSVYESIEAQGIILRTETVIPATNIGHVYYTVENGSRVAKNGVIASVYASAGDGLIAQQIKELDAHIKTLRALQTNDSSTHVTLDIINTQLSGSLDDLITDANNGVFEQASGLKSNLLSLLSKKQIVTGKTVDFTKEIAQLEQKRNSLKTQYRSALSVIKAPVAGYFADGADGYEPILSEIDPLTLTTENINELVSMQQPAPIASSGKIVGGYEWYFGCVVPDSYYNSLAVGNSLSLKMSFVSDDEIPVTVAACNKDNSGKLAVVFRCAYMSEALSTIRKETAQLLLVRHTGLKVPKRAIVINDEMQAGVYVRSGNVAAFRKIDQQFSEPADYVISKMTDESGYLHMYDDIIVSGKGLYDGKTIA